MNKLFVAFLWHMHQPMYKDPLSGDYILPWVRLHSIKGYNDMLSILEGFPAIRQTFNLVPSLLDQLDLYLSGGTDRHLELTHLPVEELSSGYRLELLESFFTCNPATMIDSHPRFRELHRKYLHGADDRSTVANIFSSAELRDLQVWSNLTWIDPVFRDEELGGEVSGSLEPGLEHRAAATGEAGKRACERVDGRRCVSAEAAAAAAPETRLQREASSRPLGPARDLLEDAPCGVVLGQRIGLPHAAESSQWTRLEAGLARPAACRFAQ